MIELPVVNGGEKPTRKRKPSWLRVKLPIGESYKKVRNLVDEYNLHTICQSGNCPNMGECWGAGTATFMILGNTCTRSCSFCAVKTGRPPEYDEDEPRRVAVEGGCTPTEQDLWNLRAAHRLRRGESSLRQRPAGRRTSCKSPAPDPNSRRAARWRRRRNRS